MAEFEAVQNPMMAADVEDGLKSGALSTDEAIVAMEGKLQAMQGKIADLEARLSGPAADDRSAALAVYARIAEAPTNLHQATVFFAASDDPEDSARALRLLALGCATVLAQCAVACGVFIGIRVPACESSDQCDDGMFCEVDTGRCYHCGGRYPGGVPVPMEIGPSCVMGDSGLTVEGDGCTTLNEPGDPNFSGFNHTSVKALCDVPAVVEVEAPGNFDAGLVVEVWSKERVFSWCDACVEINYEVDPLTAYSKMMGHFDSMARYDVLALALATGMVALALLAEIKDLTLVALAIEQAGDRLSPWWRRSLSLLNGVRRWVFLPALLATVPSLVLVKGGDALNICFNTVAVLFLTDIDNALFAVFLAEKVRSRVEEQGRITLDAPRAAALSRAKPIYTGAIMVAVLGSVALVGQTPALNLATFLFSVGAFWATSVALAFDGAGAAETCKRIATSTGAALLGMLGWVQLMLLSGGTE